MPKDSKKIVFYNLFFWIIAALLHPLSRLLPTESGQPPKIFSLLIPMIFVMLAVSSTALVRKALNHNSD